MMTLNHKWLTRSGVSHPISVDRLRIVRINEVMRLTGISKSTIYRWIKENKFPNQLKLSGKISGWQYGVIEDWLQSKNDMKNTEACHD